MSTNPCICTYNTPTPEVDPCNGNECCLLACNTVISANSDTAVTACSQTGSFDMTTLSHYNTGCTGSIKYYLHSSPNIFTNVSISEAGMLSWTTLGDSATAGQYGTIVYKISCTSNCSDFSTLESYGTIQIGVKDACDGGNCPPGEICDPCTGNCEPVVDLEADSGDVQLQA